MIASSFSKSLFSKCIFEDIICNGESENSSLLEFTSVTSGTEFKFDDVIIRNCKSNGNLINIKGDLTTLKFSHLTINDVVSYGPLINNESIKVNYIFYITIKIKNSLIN